jgi:hypothetical protein
MKRIPCNKGYLSRGKLDLKQQRYYRNEKKQQQYIGKQNVVQKDHSHNLWC